MSYKQGSSFIDRPDGALAPAGGTVDTGWPHTHTFTDASKVTHTTAAIEISVEKYGGGDVKAFCAKCGLKLRGWNDEVLPCAWLHPDLF
jgi:hypothetical protein